MPSKQPSISQQITERADQILLKLLDKVEHDIDHGVSDSPHMALYETLCRAEATRTG